MEKFKYKLIYLEWHDAVACNEWGSDEFCVDVCHTVGFLIKETKKSYLVAATYSDDQFNNRIAIPKSWVTKKRFIRQ